MAIRKGSSYKTRTSRRKTISSRAFEHALDIELMIIDRMEELGLRKKDLAERVGMSQSGLSNLLNGQPNMTLETMTRFEVALDAVFEISLKPSEQYVYSIDITEKHHDEHPTPIDESPSLQSLEKNSYHLYTNQPDRLIRGTESVVGESAIASNKELYAA